MCVWRICKCKVRSRESDPKEKLKGKKRKFSEKPKMGKRFRRDETKGSLNKSAWIRLVSVWMALREC